MKLVGTVTPTDIIRVFIAEEPDPNAPPSTDGKPAQTRKFHVGMAYLSRRILREQARAATTREWDEKTRKWVEGFDQHAHAIRYLRDLMPTATGLTPSLFLSLVELEEGVEIDVDLDEHGCIPWDHDKFVFSEKRHLPDGTATTVNYSVPLMLYEFAKPLRFKSIVEGAQRDWHDLKEQEKKSALTTSASSADSV